MQGKVYLNGTVVAPLDAKVSVFDRGFLYGDSVFETLRVYHGQPFALQAHLERLYASGERVGFFLPWTPSHLQDALKQTLHAAGFQDAYVRIIATRGEGTMGLDPGLAVDPKLIILVLPLPALSSAMYEHGVSVRLVSVCRMPKRSVDPLAKTGNYLNSVLAMREAKSHGAAEAIMLDREGRVAEASAANVFAFVDGAWATPPLDVGILSGITRQTILGLCAQHHIPAAERVLWPDDLVRAEEIFLCASVREIIPVTRLDDGLVGQGTVGPHTQKLRALYADAVLRSTELATAAARG